MPELPEVEVVRAGLEPAITDSVIETVEVFDVRSLRRHPGTSEDFVDRLVGRRVLAAVRRGKFLWFPLDGPGTAGVVRDDPADAPEALVAHLGMSGQVLLRDRMADDPLTRIRLDVAHPELGELRLNFVDQRIFGSMAIADLVPTVDGAAGGWGGPGLAGGDAGRGVGGGASPRAGHPEPPGNARIAASAPFVPVQVAHIARDPLDPAFNEVRFFAALAKRRTGIKRALLDQTLISGIGNIYADESLWAARIHYDQPTDELSRRRAGTLLAEVRLVLRRALAEGGTSFDAQYVNVNGASGYFSHSLNAYGQTGKACPRCGRPITRASFMNRSSHFCAYCQRLR